jgi:hypothetical protein
MVDHLLLVNVKNKKYPTKNEESNRYAPTTLVVEGVEKRVQT